MTSRRFPVIATTLALGVALVATVAASPQTQSPKPEVFSLIGCVERIMPGTPATPTSTPPPPPAYKLMDVQPGTVGDRPIPLGREYRLSATETIDFAKHQNHWVEVTGTVGPPSPPVPVSGRGSAGSGQKPAAVLPVFNVTAVKQITNECR